MKIELTNQFKTLFLDDPTVYAQEQALISYFQGIKARIEKELPHLEKCSGKLSLTVIDMRLLEWEYENFSEIEKFQIRAIINSQAVSEL